VHSGGDGGTGIVVVCPALVSVSVWPGVNVAEVRCTSCAMWGGIAPGGSYTAFANVSCTSNDCGDEESFFTVRRVCSRLP
jgi:hypothetical protein